MNNIALVEEFEAKNKGYKLISEGKFLYVHIDFEKVKGFLKLSDRAKALFKYMYKEHNSVQGLDYKIKWIPVSVKEHKGYLEVRFANKEWLHFTQNGEWF